MGHRQTLGGEALLLPRCGREVFTGQHPGTSHTSPQAASQGVSMQLPVAPSLCEAAPLQRATQATVSPELLTRAQAVGFVQTGWQRGGCPAL